MIWIIGLIALAIGAALGVIFSKATQKDYDEQKTKIDELETQISQAQQASNAFQDQVSDHFVKTSELFEEMTEKYREIYQQLSTDAQSLCKPETSAALLNSTIEVQELKPAESIESSDIAETDTTEKQVVAAEDVDQLTEEKAESTASEPEAAQASSVVDDELKVEDKKSDVVEAEASNVKDEAVTEVPAAIKEEGSRPSIH